MQNPNYYRSEQRFEVDRTRRRNWSESEELKEFRDDFKYWNGTEEGKNEVEEHNKKSKFVREFFTVEKIQKITQDDAFELWGKLYASGVVSFGGQPTFFQNKIIDANGGFDNFRSKLLDFVKNGDVYEKYENGVKNIKGFGGSTMSEILCDMRPKECTIWNKQVIDAIQILQIQRLFTKDLQEGKSVTTAEDYRDVVQRIEHLKNV